MRDEHASTGAHSDWQASPQGFISDVACTKDTYTAKTGLEPVIRVDVLIIVCDYRGVATRHVAPRFFAASPDISIEIIGRLVSTAVPVNVLTISNATRLGQKWTTWTCWILRPVRVVTNIDCDSHQVQVPFADILSVWCSHIVDRLNEQDGVLKE